MAMCQARGPRDWLLKHVRQGPGRRALIMKVSEVGGALDGFRSRVRTKGPDRTHGWVGWIDGWMDGWIPPPLFGQKVPLLVSRSSPN